ncbi:unnamed protein product [Fusarium graminearum]|nr:unnamed protein product [Fusarium graminearum]VTO86027.1 unnamed protein product [Fusarium graminearum]
MVGGSIVLDLANGFQALSGDAESFLDDRLWHSKAELSIRRAVSLGSVAVGCRLGVSAVGTRGYGVQGRVVADIFEDAAEESREGCHLTRA